MFYAELLAFSWIYRSAWQNNHLKLSHFLYLEPLHLVGPILFWTIDAFWRKSPNCSQFVGIVFIVLRLNRGLQVLNCNNNYQNSFYTILQVVPWTLLYTYLSFLYQTTRYYVLNTTVFITITVRSCKLTHHFLICN